jgi:hypothetical protein
VELILIRIEVPLWLCTWIRTPVFQYETIRPSWY